MNSIVGGSIPKLSVDGDVCTRTLSILQLGAASGEHLSENMARQGWNIVSGKADLQVVVASDYLAPELEALNQASIRDGQPWLLVRWTPIEVWLGPLFDTKATACWACLAHRLRESAQMDSFLRNRGDVRRLFNPSVAPAATEPLVLALLSSLLSEAAFDLKASPLRDKVLVFDVATAALQHSPVSRRPQCPFCSTTDQLGPSRLLCEAESARKCESAWEVYSRSISRITGAVQSLSDGFGIPGLFHTCTAIHTFPVMFSDIGTLQHNLRGRSGGKGLTRRQARLTAICEALERYSGMFHADEKNEIFAFCERPQEAIHPNALMLFSDEQYRNRLSWNASQSENRFHVVPRRFQEDVPISWSALSSLTHKRTRWVPSSYCYYGHPDLEIYGFCGADSNGCAAGRTPVDALLNAFFELVERDSVAIWWYNRIRRPAINLSQWQSNKVISRTLETYEKLGRTLSVLDLTSDLGVPTFAAVSSRRDLSPSNIILGFGAHFSAQNAVEQSLRELNQSLAMVAQWETRGYMTSDAQTIHWFRHRTLETEPYLVPHPGLSSELAKDVESPSMSHNTDMLKRAVSLTAAAGFDFLFLDQTREDIRLPVYRVIIPGLRHFWRRLGTGRLYTVPVRQGWLTSATAEGDLNPVSVYF